MLSVSSIRRPILHPAINITAMQPTQPLQRSLRRLPLTTKQGPHNYYKGNRTGSLGWHTKYGGYRIDFSKVRTYVCPDIGTEFPLKPFVTKVVQKPRGTWNDGYINGVMDGKRYLKLWKEEARQGWAE